MRSSRQSPAPSDATHTERQVDHQLPILLSDGLPPVPARLVKRVKQGMFVEMAELFPDYLSSAEANTGDQPTSSKTKLQEVNNILDWIQCFGVYMAILSRSAPQRVADLVGYQSLIISASLYYREGRWAIYDRRFRLKASASNIKKWSAIDVTIWNTVFPDHALGNYQSGRSQLTIPANSYRLPRQPAFNNKQQICLNWNENPEGCSRSTCRYEHICYRCVHNPRVTDKRHKAIECPHREKRAATQLQKRPPALMSL